MQNRYVGDIGDFGKYGLLKALCLPGNNNADSKLSLGVVWYLVPDEKNNDDGKHIRYLEDLNKNKNWFRRCDPLLYDTLAKIVLGGERHITKIREYGVLPLDTIYYEEPLTYDGMPKYGMNARQKRIARRHKWVQGALDETIGCDVIFVDPDNGLEVRSVKRHHKLGPKYTFFNELSGYLARNQSLIIYQHLSRKGSAEEQIEERFSQINERFKGCDDVFALCFHRGTSRAFFIIPSKIHKDILLDRAERFLKTPWSKHFTHISFTIPKK